MLLPTIAILLGITLLVWSADKFVEGAAALARGLGMSTLLIGLTIVSFGTSAPEILVSTTAAIVGASGIAVGNAVGSNIANIGLVLGITALVVPLPVSSPLVRKEFPILAAVTILGAALLIDQSLSRWDGLFMLGELVIVLILFAKYHPAPSAHDLMYSKDSTSADTLPDDDFVTEELTQSAGLSTSQAIFRFTLGLLVLVLSSRILVWGCTQIATYLGVSDLLIGLTIVALGTSLPELAASVVSAMRGHHDIALGNVIGSNIFNLLAVLSIPAVIAPFEFPAVMMLRDYSVMALLTSLLIVFCLFTLRKSGSRRLGRGVGVIFLASYIGYLTLLYFQAL